MSRSRWHLTPELEREIVAYVRAGGYPHAAALAAGVPTHVFEQWLQRGDRPRAPERYRALADAVRKAQGQARLTAEITVHDKRPLDWLKHGPGKQTKDHPGWTGPARAAESRARQTQLLLECPEMFTQLIAALEPYPEARAAVSEILANTLADADD